MAVITISRQYGSGGWAVGQIVADALGYELVDHSMLDKVAQDAKVSVKSVQEIEKSAGDFFLSLFSELAASLSVVRHVPGVKDEFDENKYRLFLKRTISQIAVRGNAVIIGRGGQMILKDHPKAIRIYLVAEDEDRIKYLMNFYGYDRKRAETVALKEEKKRLNFLTGFDSGNPEDPHLYHLIINSSVVRDAVSADLICSLVKSKEAEHTASGR